MDPALVLFLIRAGIRVGSASASALEQLVRDEALELPDIYRAQEPIDLRLKHLYRNQLAPRVSPPDGDLAALWSATAEPGGGPVDAAAQERLLEIAEEYWATVASSYDVALEQEARGRNVLRQWKAGEGPPQPWVRVALSLAEVGLEFAQVRPDAFGLDGDGARVVTAVAAEIHELLPDADDPDDWRPGDWTRFHFAERSLSILLRAGLRTLNSHPDLVTDEKHIQELVRSTTAPLLESFSQDPERQLDFLRLQETLLGPVAQAAFRTLAENQSAFLGKRFGPEKAVGAITAAVLDVAQQEGIAGLAEDGSLFKLADAVIGVAAKRPGLFLGDGGDPERELARGALAAVAGTLADAIDDDGIVLSEDLVVDLAVATLGVVAETGPKLFDGSEPWQNVAAGTVTQLARALSDGLGDDGVLEFEEVFSREQAVELARIVLEQAARTPGMLTPGAGSEVQAIVTAVARAMASDERLLLSPEHWHSIVAVAAEEAARNPGRLFGLDDGTPEHRLGAAVIQKLLQAASQSFAAGGTRSGPLGFGATLGEAVEVALRASVGNLEGALQAAGLVEVDGASLDNFGLLVRRIDELAASRRGQVGSREWSWLFRHLVVDAIDDGAGFDPTVARMIELLQENVA